MLYIALSHLWHLELITTLFTNVLFLNKVIGPKLLQVINEL